jgi:predicted AAA+ superfamily ATPase
MAQTLSPLTLTVMLYSVMLVVLYSESCLDTARLPSYEQATKQSYLRSAYSKILFFLDEIQSSHYVE